MTLLEIENEIATLMHKGMAVGLVLWTYPQHLMPWIILSSVTNTGLALMDTFQMIFKYPMEILKVQSWAHYFSPYTQLLSAQSYLNSMLQITYMQMIDFTSSFTELVNYLEVTHTWIGNN